MPKKVKKPGMALPACVRARVRARDPQETLVAQGFPGGLVAPIGQGMEIGTPLGEGRSPPPPIPFPSAALEKSFAACGLRAGSAL